MELWKVAETAHFFPALLVWLKQFGGHRVVASMGLFFFLTYQFTNQMQPFM